MSEDLIRRSDAIKAVASLHILADEEKIFKVYADNPHSMTTDFEGTLIDAINAIKSIPTIEPKRGEWVLDPNGIDWNIPAWRCSRCGFVANYIGVEANGFGSNPMNWAGSNYCPNCGADMRGPDSE